MSEGAQAVVAICVILLIVAVWVVAYAVDKCDRESEARDAKLESAIKDIYSKLGEVSPRIFAPKCPHYFYEHHAGNDNWRECHSCGYKQPL